LQKVLAQDRDVVPPSIGIVNGIYPATINDDVVALSNAVVALGYVVALLEGHLSRPRRLRIVFSNALFPSPWRPKHGPRRMRIGL